MQRAFFVLVFVTTIAAFYRIYKKIGIARCCKKLFYIFSCHWIFRMIINYRATENFFIDKVDKVVFNDPEIVKQAMDNSNIDPDNSNVEKEIYKQYINQKNMQQRKRLKDSITETIELAEHKQRAKKLDSAKDH